MPILRFLGPGYRPPLHHDSLGPLHHPMDLSLNFAQVFILVNTHYLSCLFSMYRSTILVRFAETMTNQLLLFHIYCPVVLSMSFVLF